MAIIQKPPPGDPSKAWPSIMVGLVSLQFRKSVNLICLHLQYVRWPRPDRQLTDLFSSSRHLVVSSMAMILVQSPAF